MRTAAQSLQNVEKWIKSKEAVDPVTIRGSDEEVMKAELEMAPGWALESCLVLFLQKIKF
jgi:hypothetical protein